MWLDAQASHLFEPYQLFSATWPTSGMMLDGQAYELRTSGHHIKESVSLLLPTLKARDAQAEGYEAGLRRSTPQLGTIVRAVAEKDDRVISQDINLLMTPTAVEGEGGAVSAEVKIARGHFVMLRDQIKDLVALPTPRATRGGSSTETQTKLLPTTRVSMARGSSSKERDNGNPKHRLEVTVELLPTPVVDDASNTGHNKVRFNGLCSTAYDLGNDQPEINWGKYEGAIRRWELVIDRPAPEPTRPDGKNGVHRLSPEFTEWMMGLPKGWITECGLRRTEELKACGNGVVPQQAMLALSILLEDLPEHIKLSTE